MDHSGRRQRAAREARGQTGAEFGAYLANVLGRARPYDRREVSAWETGATPIPEAVERALLRLELNAEKARKKR